MPEARTQLLSHVRSLPYPPVQWILCSVNSPSDVSLGCLPTTCPAGPPFGVLAWERITSCRSHCSSLKFSLPKCVPSSVQTPSDCHYAVCCSFKNVKCDAKGKLGIPILQKTELHKDKQSLMLSLRTGEQGRDMDAVQSPSAHSPPLWPETPADWVTRGHLPASHYLQPRAHDWVGGNGR